MSAALHIGIIGGGYVGLVTGACFASLGHRVTIIETEARKLNILLEGGCPIYEPGLPELIEQTRQRGLLKFSGSGADLFTGSGVAMVFLAVGTPQRPDGSCDLRALRASAEQVAELSGRELVLVVKSTVPAGTARTLARELSQKHPGKKISVVNNPEFLTEGTALNDFLKPSRIVIGGSDTAALEKVRSAYAPLVAQGFQLFSVDHEAAELGKLAANLVLASRISIINQVSLLSASLGADIREIETILRSDPRIGPRYLYAGLGYGGSCFPKDVKSFIRQCEDHGVEASMAHAVDSFNSRQKVYFLPHITKRFPSESTTIGLLGTSFKPLTDDIRESPALTMTEALHGAGYRIAAFDPQGLANYMEWAKSCGFDRVSAAASTQDLLSRVDAVIIVTEWQEFRELTPATLKAHFKGKAIFDGKNVLDHSVFKAAGFDYLGVGRA